MFKKDVKELVELNKHEDNSEIMKLTRARKVRLVLKAYGELLGKKVLTRQKVYVII